ncbi:hypothetical protein J3A83DRAFT_4356436 [Scleroderma citrinum]
MVQTLSLCRNVANPLVHHGHHFGRTVHVLCNFQVLLTNRLLQMGKLADVPEENFTGEDFYRERCEHHVFQELLRSVLGLEECLMAGSAEEVDIVSELLFKDVSGARGDDTKSLKGTTYRIKAKLWNGEIVISGDQWPLFLYADYWYDSEDPWNGLFHSASLVSHVFTSPSSVDKELKATCSSNAQIHGMTQVTPSSITYIATQVQFSLMSSPVFSHTDTVTDLEQFYNSLLELFEDPDEKQEVDELLVWWNR